MHRYHREEILSDINYLYLYGTTCNLITSGVGGGVGLCQCIRFHNVCGNQKRVLCSVQRSEIENATFQKNTEN